MPYFVPGFTVINGYISCSSLCCCVMSVALSACVVQHCEIRQRCCDSDLAGQHPGESVSMCVSECVWGGGGLFSKIFFSQRLIFFSFMYCLTLRVWTFLWIFFFFKSQSPFSPLPFQLHRYVTLFVLYHCTGSS